MLSSASVLPVSASHSRFNCGPAGAGDFARLVEACKRSKNLFQLRPRRSGGFCPPPTRQRLTRGMFQLRPRRSGGFCQGLWEDGDPQPRFQLRPRRSGGFCPSQIPRSPASSSRFQLRPRRSGGFCSRGIWRHDQLFGVSIAAPPERGILRSVPVGVKAMGAGCFNCGPAGAGDFAIASVRSSGFRY